MTKDRQAVTRLKRPRWVQRIRAFLSGYFWVACPICRRMYGGHETSELGCLMHDTCSGQSVCCDCGHEANRLSNEMRERRGGLVMRRSKQGVYTMMFRDEHEALYGPMNDRR